MPEGRLQLCGGDVLVFAAKRYEKTKNIDLREVKIKEENPWVGRRICELDISRLELIVAIERNGRSMVPNGQNVIKSGDTLLIYSKKGD